MVRFILLLSLAALCTAFIPHNTAAAGSLGSQTIQLADLRAGYTVTHAGYRSATDIASRRRISPQTLLRRGWARSYEAVYTRRDNPRVQVGDYTDQFHGIVGAQWWYGVSIHHLPAGYASINLARVGDESTAVQSGSALSQTGYVGIIFRRSRYVVDVYVSLAAPFPYGAVLTLARRVDQRLQTAPGKPPSAATPAPVKIPALVVRAWVSPPSMLPGAYPILYARTSPGAVCTASIAYSARGYLRTFDGSARVATTGGMVSWSWHVDVRGTTGKASVACTYRGQSRSAVAFFRVTS